MSAFLIGAALLLAVSFAFLLWPLLRGPAASTGRDRAIVSMYREQLRELSAEHASAAINAEQFEAGRRELERRLLEEVAQDPSVPAAARRSVVTAIAVFVFVLVVPVSLYLALGRPEAIRAGTGSAAASGGDAAQKGAGHAITPKQVQDMIDQLAKRLEQNPDDGQGWAMLARSYSYVRNFPQAVKAYAKAAQLLPGDSHVLADYADALAMTQDRRLAGEPMKLIKRSLAINPDDVKALALAGSDAFDRRDYTAAIGYWEHAVKANPQEPQFVEQLQAGIREARQLGGKGAMPPVAAAADATPSGAGSAPADVAATGKTFVQGQVRLAPALAGRAGPNDTLFIFARATQGPRVPVALLKRQVKDLPVQFTLDETMSMIPDLNLSKFGTVIIGARISRNGDAIASSGDLQGFSGPVKVGSMGVQVQIDQLVP